MDLLKRGERKTQARAKVADIFRTPYDSLETGQLGAGKLNSTQMAAILQLYHSSPSIQAARAILLGQLLSSGIVVRRHGEDVPLTEQFAKHLESVWIPFARSVVDSFLCFGFVVVSIEEEEPPPFAGFLNKRKEAKEALDKTTRKRSRNTGTEEAINSALNLVPCVCDFGSYEISFKSSGRRAYKRTYTVSSIGQGQNNAIDLDLGFFIRQPPDMLGNINSPVATCFSNAAFIAALTELALNAETVRARTQIVTQAAPKQNASQTQLDAANLFFDSESRAIQQNDEASAETATAESLSAMVHLCNVLNKMQTTVPGEPQKVAQSHVPPEQPPRLFTLPDRQVVAPSVQRPEVRTDLDALTRMVNESICSSLGVPASVVFEGKFSSNSMSQLQLLNTTVSSLAIAVNAVLTNAYHACYQENNARSDEDELLLVTAPLSATSEVVALFKEGVIDATSAIPAALHSLGCSSNEITEALRRKQESVVASKEAENNTADLEQKTATVERTRAEVDRIKADTKVAQKALTAPAVSK